jgi:hypothetical protein
MSDRRSSMIKGRIGLRVEIPMFVRAKQMFVEHMETEGIFILMN